MKILAFNYEYPPLGGGGGVFFKGIYDEIAERHDVRIVTSLREGLPRHETRGRQEIYRVPVVHRKNRSTASGLSLVSYLPSSLRCGAGLLKREQFDIINSHFVVPTSPSAQMLAKRFRVPHAVSILGGDVFDPSKRMSPHRVPVLRGVVKHLLNSATRVIAGSTDIADHARKQYGITREIDLVPLGIERPEYTPGDRAELGLESDRFVMTTVGRLVRRKGLDELLGIVKALDDPRILLVVLGDGPQREALEAQARELGIADRVRFLGYVEEDMKWKLLSVSDLYVSTSTHEGFGLVFLEAMHAGLPVVCYDRGGQTDFLDDGQTGALVPLGRSDLLEAAVRRFAADPDLTHTCAEFNRQRVKDYYVDRCARRYEELFEEILRTERRHEA